MPLQNRVTPFGHIVATPARGTLMGNRGGCMHDRERRLTNERWVNRRWITCLLAFRGRHREVMSPGRYTELFFLDEATAFAAGHRPCFECRRVEYRRFRSAWSVANPYLGIGERDPVDDLDRVLHVERTASLRPEADPGRLPAGSMVAFDALPDTPWLITAAGLRRWSFTGYAAVPPPPGPARLLTPPSVVAAFDRGYAVSAHPSAHLPETAGDPLR